MSRPALNLDDVAQKIRDARGNIAAVAQQLHIGRQTLYRYIEAHPSLQPVILEARETMKDMAESVLYSKVLAGEPWAVCFFLKTQAKDRGYVERAEMTGKDGESLSVTTRVVRKASDEANA